MCACIKYKDGDILVYRNEHSDGMLLQRDDLHMVPAQPLVGVQVLREVPDHDDARSRWGEDSIFSPVENGRAQRPACQFVDFAVLGRGIGEEGCVEFQGGRIAQLTGMKHGQTNDKYNSNRHCN